MGKPKRRGNGEGTVYKQGKTWMVERRVMSNGQYQRSRKGGFPNKAAAKAYLYSLLNIDPNKVIHSTDDMYKEWSRIHFAQIGKSKQDAYNSVWKRMKSMHGLDIETVNYDMVQSAVDAFKTHYPCRDAKTILNGIFEHAMKNQYISFNPAQYIIIPKANPKEKQIFSEQEVQTMWDKLEDVPELSYILIMIYTGMRPNELLKLRPSHIYLDFNEIRGAGSKTQLGKELPIVFPDRIKPLLTDYKPLGGDRSWQYDLYARALKKAGIRYLTPNSCRHTCASLLTKKGVPPAAIQRIMRHTSYKTTLGYTHLDNSDAIGGVNLL